MDFIRLIQFKINMAHILMYSDTFEEIGKRIGYDIIPIMQLRRRQFRHFIVPFDDIYNRFIFL